MNEGVLRHSKWDALLILLSVAQGAVLAAAPSAPIIALGLWWNSNTISHNFIHLPFFRSAACNRLFSMYLTLLLGLPQSLWRDRHLAHHGGRPFRMRLNPAIGAETACLILMWAMLATRWPDFFLRAYLPGYAAGLALCYIHGHFEHARGTKSHYGLWYNAPFFNDGYHVEHHMRPGEHWTRLPRRLVAGVPSSRWPAVLRWIEIFNLETLERLALRSPRLQKMLLKTHERALRRLLPRLPRVRKVTIVGGGMFPRTALILERVLPGVEITIVDANPASIAAARTFLSPGARLVCGFFDCGDPDIDADLVVFPLSFIGNRAAVYKNPPATAVLIHDWIWARAAEGAVVSPWLLKRINLVRR